MKITEAQAREWLDKVTAGEISFSRMVELINEKKEAKAGAENMNLYRVTRLYESGDLYVANILNLDDCLKAAEKSLKEEIDEMEFYGKTAQRNSNIETLTDIVDVLKYKKDQQ